MPKGSAPLFFRFEENMTDNTENVMVCVGVVTSAHGIRGAVNIKSYTENPSDISSYGPIYSEGGEKEYKIKILSVKKDRVIAIIDGLDTRNDAEKLKGLKLFVSRSALPDIDNDEEFYSEDLIGISAIFDDGTEFGTVKAIHNYGACDILEIQLKDSDREELVAFTRELVPEVNIEEGYIVIDLPEIEFVSDNDNVAPENTK